MTSITPSPDRKSLRASDGDRERAAEILRDAAGEGRLGLDELDERLTAVYAAKTYAELEPVLQDLPNAGTAPVAAPADKAVSRVGGDPTSSAAIAVMGGFSRKGAWVVPAEFTAVAVMGGGDIDLREARFAERVVTIHAYAIMGGIAITVPEDVEVQVTGVGLMGAFEHGSTGAPKPGGPKLIVNGLAFWGAVDVKRKPLKRPRARKELDSAPGEDAGRPA
jgi:hypothetical protein